MDAPSTPFAVAREASEVLADVYRTRYSSLVGLARLLLSEDGLRDALRADAGAAAYEQTGWDRVVRDGNARRGLQRGVVLGASATVVAAAAVFGGLALMADENTLETVPPGPVLTQPEVPTSASTETPMPAPPTLDTAGIDEVCRTGIATTIVDINLAPTLPAAPRATVYELHDAMQFCRLEEFWSAMAPDFTSFLGDTPDAVVRALDAEHGWMLAIAATLGGEFELIALEPTDPESLVAVGVYMSSAIVGGQEYRIAFEAQSGKWRLFEHGPTTVSCSASEVGGDLVLSAEFPAAATFTAAKVMAAAIACYWGALRALMADEFTYSFGGSNDPDEAIDQWQQAEARGEPILQTLVTRLHAGVGDLESDDIARRSDPEDEFGYRVGIDSSGEWIYFVAGD
ncbi:MAG: hypothetical protein ACT4OX_12185 [Actinomycetota bacterium]